jgi:exopolysaccharide biosynthesis polyprenyl glycosylphosphotransferase
MIKLFNVHFPKRTLLLLTTESLLICSVLLATALIHFGRESSTALVAHYGYFKLGVVAIICIFFLYCSNLYAPSFVGGSPKTHSNFLRGLGIACIVIALLYSIVPSLQLYRGFVIVGITVIAIILITHRQVFFEFLKTAELESVVILGDGRFATSVAKVFRDRPELGLRLLGYLGNEWKTANFETNVRRLGGIEDLLLITNQLEVDRIIVAMGEQRRKLPVNELLALKTSGVAIQDAADFYEVALGKLPVENVRTSWLIFSPGFKVSRVTLLYKRVLSIILASFGLLLLSPLIALIAIAIKLDSKGSVVFSQRRLGLNGTPFVLYKFRTMRTNADNGGYARPVEHDDERVTRVGRLLRLFRLDEVPQLWNILRGDMYLVGPRPFVIEQEQDCARQIPLYVQRWTVRPGATGWAQVQRGYCASLQDNIDKLSYDLFYIKNMSISFDLLIILKTIKIVLSAQGGR